MDTSPTEIEKIPGPGVNKPASGTYGEKKDVADLKASFPSSDGGGPAPMTGAGDQGAVGAPGPVIAPTPPAQNNSPMQPTGVPQILLGPTARPNEPVATSSPPPPVITRTQAEQRIAWLDQLANSDEVSPETREWAQGYLDMILG